MMPFADAQALQMFVIHALRDMSSQQRETTTAVKDVQSELRIMREEGIARSLKVEGAVERLEAAEKSLEGLCAEQQQRAGMKWLLEWIGRYTPWLFAAAASIWAVARSLGSPK